jgi:hypothetical protein
LVDSKIDSKNHLHLLLELADHHLCNNILYFEVHRHYLWAAKRPNGLSIKLHVQNVHTMDKLKMMGNCLIILSVPIAMTRIINNSILEVSGMSSSYALGRVR